MKYFPIWKTIRIGGVTREELVTWIPPRAYYDRGRPLREELLDYESFQTEKEQRYVRLARASFSDLGLTRPALFSQILARIRELGHELCPAEVGPHLRRVYTDQPRGENMDLAMEPFVRPPSKTITHINGKPVGPDRLIFYLDYNNIGQQRLELGYVGSPDFRRSGGEYVFVLGE